MSKHILTKSIMIDIKFLQKIFLLITREKQQQENDYYLYLFFPTSIFLYFRSSAFFIDHCGNEIISRTSDQPIEDEEEEEKKRVKEDEPNYDRENK